MSDERLVVYKCAICGSIEGSFPQAGCCASCGDSGDPLTVEVVPWSRPLPSQRDDSRDPLANVERLLTNVLPAVPLAQEREAVRLLLKLARDVMSGAEDDVKWTQGELVAFARSLGGDPQ